MDQDQPTNPNSLKATLAVNFLQAVKKLNGGSNNYKSLHHERKRYHVVRTAAYSSMAFSIGPKRAAWARALLGKIKNRTLNRYLTTKKSRISRHRRQLRTIVKRRNPRKDIYGISQEDELRRLVPGGEGMDFCRLLTETAHFMITLKAQIKVMEYIVDRYSIQD